MEKLSDKKQIRQTILLFALTYMVSYMTRINFGAVITAIVEESGMTKTMLSAAMNLLIPVCGNHLQMTALLWFVIAAAGGIICLLCSRVWK